VIHVVVLGGGAAGDVWEEGQVRVTGLLEGESDPLVVHEGGQREVVQAAQKPWGWRLVWVVTAERWEPCPQHVVKAQKVC